WTPRPHETLLSLAVMGSRSFLWPGIRDIIGPAVGSREHASTQGSHLTWPSQTDFRFSIENQGSKSGRCYDVVLPLLCHGASASPLKPTTGLNGPPVRFTSC